MRRNHKIWLGLRFGFPAGATALLILIWFGGIPESIAFAPGTADPARSPQPPRASFAASFSKQVFINEIHYDNSSTDTGEGVEIAGPAGTDLQNWELVLYNGNGGAAYGTVLLSGLIPDQDHGFGCIFFPIDSLQNGSPDGIALFSPIGAVVQFLSYEGILKAMDGPARGFLSLDILMEENGSDPEGYSLQLIGAGDEYDDFTWSSPALSSYGSPNLEQDFLASSKSGELQVGISAPSYVDPGVLVTYTLTVQNLFDFPLHSIVITDAVPSRAVFAYALDGGLEKDGLVSWEVDVIPQRSSVERRFIIQTPIDLQTLLINDRYGAISEGWTSPAYGDPIFTVVGEYMPVYFIQGKGNLSPMQRKPVITRGVVTGFFQGNTPDGHSFNGFFLQDVSGDGDLQTSDGLFVFLGTSGIPVNIGSLVEASGVVQEYDDYDGLACPGDDCLTQVAVSDTSNVSVMEAGSVLPLILDPPRDVAQAAVYFEAREAMLVMLPVTATVTGPTSFGTLSILPGDEGQERVLRGSPQEGMTFGLRNWERSGDIDGRNAPGLITGSVVDHVRGPLTWSYDDYLVVTQPGAPWIAVTSWPEPATAPSWPAPGSDQFSAATLNTDKLNGWGVQFTKMISNVLQMNGPTFLALQEVNPTSVFPSLIERLANKGYHYGYAFSDADAGGFGVALLWREESVQDVSWSTGYQDCSPNGSPSSTFDPLWATCRSRGEYPLFARRPVVVSGTLAISGSRLPVVVIANHFKSRLEAESSEQRRLEEASFVGKLVSDLSPGGSIAVIVMGDLNDFEDSHTLQALTAGGRLVNTWMRVPQQDHYSFIYHGVSQVLDHILITPNLLPMLGKVAPLHTNADFPYSPYASNIHNLWRSSDHDPVAALFAFPYGNRIYLSIINGK